MIEWWTRSISFHQSPKGWLCLILPAFCQTGKSRVEEQDCSLPRTPTTTWTPPFMRRGSPGWCWPPVWMMATRLSFYSHRCQHNDDNDQEIICFHFVFSLGHLISLKCPGTQGQQRMSAWHPDCEIPWRSQRRNRAGHDCHSGPVVQCNQTRDQPPSEFRATLVFLTWTLFNWHSVCWTTLPIIFCTKKKKREQIIHELTILNFYWQNCWF